MHQHELPPLVKNKSNLLLLNNITLFTYICRWNYRCSKVVELQERMTEEQPHIITIMDTKLASVIESVIFPREYYVVRKDRVTIGGGCVALLPQQHFEEVMVTKVIGI